jgi:gamma-glutamyltranspeptidase / glutathione hydrolase / leukotriene-C4 hydrolase
MALNILENFDLKSMGIGPKSIHLVVEALKFAFAHRLDLGDPDFVDIEETVAKMLDKNYAKTLAAAISRNATHDPAFYWPTTPHKKRYLPEDKGTTHISVVDKDRNVISLTTTVNAEFGSCFMGPETGIIYNNQMDDFSSPGVPNYYGLAPSDENFIAPRKRPVSSMTPLIVLDGEGAPVLSIGGTGGPRIFTNVLQSVLNILIWNKNIKASTLMPRYHHQLIPNVLRYENDNPLPEATIKELKSFGHKMIMAAVGVVNGVHIVEHGEMLEAASDWRKYANARGY